MEGLYRRYSGWSRSHQTPSQPTLHTVPSPPFSADAGSARGGGTTGETRSEAQRLQDFYRDMREKLNQARRQRDKPLVKR